MANESAVRSKPAWLKVYELFIWAGLFLSVFTVYRYAPTATALAWPSMLGRVVIYSYAVYSLRYWETARTRTMHFALQLTITVLGIVFLTPLARLLPLGLSELYFLYAAVSVPIYSIIGDGSAPLSMPFLANAPTLVMVAISAYFSYCWHKFTPASKHSTAQREADKARRNVRDKMKKGIIAAFVLGMLALVMALADSPQPWASIAMTFLGGAVLAMIVLRVFGNDALGDEETDEPRDYDPLGSDDPDPSEAGHQPLQRQKPAAQKTDIFKKDVSGIAFALFGIPILLLIVVVAIVMTAASGEGIATFLVLVVVLIGAAIAKLR